MLEVSSSNPLASESKGLALWVEPDAGYLSYVVVSYCIGAGVYFVRTQRVAAAGFSCRKKNTLFIHILKIHEFIHTKIKIILNFYFFFCDTNLKK